MSQEFLAVVAGEGITREDLDAFMQNVPREQQAYIQNPQFRQQCLEQLTALYLFAKEGEDNKLQETEEFQKVLANARRDILAQMQMRETMRQAEVSQEEMKAYYEEHKQQYAKGERVRAKHILTDTEESCSQILEEILKGEKEFEVAAQEKSKCPSGAKGGDLGEFGRGQMVKEFEEAAFTAETGHVVGPVKTQFGYHLIKVEEKKPASEAPFEEVEGAIRRTLLQKKQHEAYDKKVADLKEKYMEK